MVEHIIEQPAWADQLEALLRPFDLFKVGIRVPMDVLEERERLRSDRALGEAVEPFVTHDYCTYDLQIENVGQFGIVAARVVSAWERRSMFPA